MDNCQKQWIQWLADFRQRLIEANKWSEKEAKLRIRDGWAFVRNGWVHVLTDNDQRPADAVPVFQRLTHGGRKLPIEIVDRLTGVIGKAMTSQRPPRDIVLGLLDFANRAEGPDESDEIKQKRDMAAFRVFQLLDACEDKALSGVIGSDVFWQAILASLEAGRRLTILELYRDPQALTDLIKAQAFQSGRGPDEVSRRLEAANLSGVPCWRGLPNRERLRRRQAGSGARPTPVGSSISSQSAMALSATGSETSATSTRHKTPETIFGAFAESPLLRGCPVGAAMRGPEARIKPSFLSDLQSCPSTFSEAHLVTLNVSPLWLRVSVAVKMSSLPRYEIDLLIKEKRVKVAWRRNKAGTLHPLLYAPSLWAYMDSLVEAQPTEKREANNG